MKKVFFSVVVLLVLLIGAAFAVPGFIDGNAYKSRIISLAESATGRSLAISGDVSLRLLPSPALSVEGVRLANVADAATAEMLSLESVQVQVALWPLLRGKVEVRSVRLVEPVIELEILADGTANWGFIPDDDA
ncbi:MAG: AsmA family protein, partial [Proteobacteria bacterium]|nr:AsmA family protein [Pseudomonadota bacterium]